MTKLGLKIFLICFLLALFSCKKEETPNPVSEEAEEEINLNDCGFLTDNISNDGSTYNGSIVLENQEQLETFGCNNFSEIKGSVRLFNTTDLSSLKSIRIITGGLYIGDFQIFHDDSGAYSGTFIRGNRELKSLKGLENLVEVGDVRILDSGLTDLSGLFGLTNIRSLWIAGNKYLGSLDGIENLKTITMELRIGLFEPAQHVYYGNTVLTNLNGLSNTSKIGSLELAHNFALINIEGLSNINSLMDLKINWCPVLTNLKGLEQLEFVERLEIGSKLINLNEFSNLSGELKVLRIANNPDLQNLDGLAGITKVTEFVEIGSNPSLTDLNGLSNITAIDSLSLRRNDLLQDLNWFSNVSSIGSIKIEECDALLNLEGFSTAITELRSLEIHSNENLGSLESLSNILAITNRLRFSYNPSLKNVDGLRNIESIKYISFFNMNVENLEGLSSLSGVEELYIDSCDVLENVDGLANVNGHIEELIIRASDNLMNIDGLTNIPSVGYLSIAGNSNLEDFCGIGSTNILNGLNIKGNAYNPTQEQLKTDACKAN